MSVSVSVSEYLLRDQYKRLPNFMHLEMPEMLLGKWHSSSTKQENKHSNKKKKAVCNLNFLQENRKLSVPRFTFSRLEFMGLRSTPTEEPHQLLGT